MINSTYKFPRKNQNYFGKKGKLFFHFSECDMTIFNKKFASQYKSLPICNPDFIYMTAHLLSR